MNLDTRLNKLAPALTARERAGLVLDAWKDGRQEDPVWRRTMPHEQSHEFNRYIDLMNSANRGLARYILVIEGQTEKLALRQAWLSSLTLWQEHVDEIGQALALTLQEPVTNSEYRRRVEEARSEWVPVQELAAMAAGDHEGWSEEDYAEGEDGEREITDAAWERVAVEKERELRSLVTRGVLPGRGRGRSLQVQMGAYDDLVGRVTAACPDEGYVAFRVVPDEEAGHADQERLGLQRLQGVLDWRPLDASPEDELADLPQKLTATLRESFGQQLVDRWVQVRVVERLVDEVALQFGTDPFLHGLPGPAPLRSKLEVDAAVCVPDFDLFAEPACSAPQPHLDAASLFVGPKLQLAYVAVDRLDETFVLQLRFQHSFCRVSGGRDFCCISDA